MDEIDKDDKTNSKNIKIWSAEINKTNVVIVDRAIDLVKEYQGNFFVGVEAVIVESSGDASTKGFVTNKHDAQRGDESKIIHIIVAPNQKEAKDKLESELSDEDVKKLLDEATSIVIANTIAHEKGHIDDKLKGGESPAENEEHKFKSFFERKWSEMMNKVKKAGLSFNQVIKLASIFERQIKSTR